jgi:hypothetical protein
VLFLLLRSQDWDLALGGGKEGSNGLAEFDAIYRVHGNKVHDRRRRFRSLARVEDCGAVKLDLEKEPEDPQPLHARLLTPKALADTRVPREGV